MVDDKTVERIRAAKNEAHRAQDRLFRIVRDARARGATWTQIGYALGVTAQGAQKRYGDGTERAQAYAENARRKAEKKAARDARRRAAEELSEG